MHHAFKLGDAEHNLELSRSASAYRLHLGEQVVDVDLKTGADGRAWLTLGERHIEVVIATRGDDVFVHLDGEAYQLRYQHPLDRLAAQAGGSAEDHIRAPMPGSIVSVSVKAGDAVAKGQTLLVMESMKMETTIAAPRDGTVAAVTYEKGQTFDRDALLLSLEPMEKKS
ncbi:acetyl-CoA carboxylase biotin carboxyl carrier protein subunit [Solimonas fluminis]|uniref:Acetyl-CoA carboxylase biotin carboxyl carrier protein subunit n=1 Tax=Solimonas fluminis TaxID=2086571 RepID=A0A2S5TFH3_9GAMM|nr:acetyl-CoA carboxylase biotin carboxyl carrier protein subunit [Solimonas fluminis]PPE73578.1 acetyl-CoA carboxylase biotin carboxyl carrier protein subunit [Solimonas fluminis]